MTLAAELQDQAPPRSPILEALGGRLYEQLAVQKDQFILWWPVFFGAGIGVYFSLPVEPSVIFSGAGCLFIAVLAALIAPARYQNRRITAIWVALILAGCFAAGFHAAILRTRAVAAPMLEKSLKYTVMQGTVVNIDDLEGGQGSHVVLEDLLIEDLPVEKTPRRIRLKIRDASALGIGDRIKVDGGLNAASPPVAPGAFDFQRYSYFRQIGAFGFNYKAPEILERRSPSEITAKLENLRHSIGARVNRHTDSPESAFIISQITGERKVIPENVQEEMRRSGLAHVVSISGLHVGLAASFIFFFSRLLMAAFPGFALRHPIKKYAAFPAIIGAAAYVLLAGADIPAVRSLLMTGIVLFALIIERQPFSLRLVAIAALVILALWPESLINAGFQMSFAAVTGMIAFYEKTRPLWTEWYRQAGWFRRFLLYLLGSCVTTIIASIATAPFVLYHFQQLALYNSLIANVLVTPVMAFALMPALVLTGLLMPFGLEKWPLEIADIAAGLILDIAHEVASMPWSVWTPPAWPVAALALFVTGGLFWALWQGRNRLIASALTAAALAVIFLYNQPDILISSSGNLISVRGQGGGLHVSTRRSDRFASEMWARRNGQDDENLSIWPVGTDKNTGLVCGEWGCRLESDGRHIAFSHHPAAHEQDCRWADILIAADPVRTKPCQAKIIIDRFSLWEKGAHAVWFDGHVETVKDRRGARPWTVTPRR